MGCRITPNCGRCGRRAMPKFRVTYVIPDYDLPYEEWDEATEVREFENQTWAEDYAYTMADKHRHSVEAL